jgi:hypothetical protein
MIHCFGCLYAEQRSVNLHKFCMQQQPTSRIGLNHKMQQPVQSTKLGKSWSSSGTYAYVLDSLPRDAAQLIQAVQQLTVE